MAKFTRNSSGQKVYSSKKSSTSSSSSKTNSGSSQTTLSNADVKALGALTGKNLSDSSINEARNRANSSGISNANDPIDASKMTNVTAVNPPEMPKVDPANGVVVAGNISVGLNPDGTTKVTEGNTDVANPVQAQLDNYLKAMSETPSAEDIYNSMPEKRAFENAAREEQKYASQINTIVAKSQADQLSTIGQGRGIPEAIIGGQQAQIAREAAIQALPLQALLANAQGNKELAQQQLDTMFKMKMQDAQAQYDYKVKYLGMVYEIADKNEQRKLNEIYRKEDQAFELLKGDIAWERQQLSDSMDFKRQKELKLMDTGSNVSGLSDAVNQIFTQQGTNTPATAKAVLAQLAGNKSISSGTRAKMAPAVEVLNSLDEFANSNLEGKFTGFGGFWGFAKLKEGVKGIFNMKSPEATTNKSQIDALNLKVGQWASGASLTADQQERVDAMVPTTWDSDKKVREKTTQLYNFMLNQAEGNLLTEGVNVQFPAVNLFEIRDLYEKASPEQKKVIEETYFNKQ